MIAAATAAPGRPRDAGFTLIELLIALTLLALLLAIVLGGFRLGTRAWEVGDARLDQLSRLQTSHEFLRRQIAQAFPADISGDDEGIVYHFFGEADHLTFVTLLPAYLAPGGFYELAVHTADIDDARQLVVDWSLFDPDEEGIPGEPEAPSILLDDIADIAFSYYGREDERDDEATWLSRWPVEDRLPELVRLDVTFRDGDPRHWPELIVAPVMAAVPRGR